MRVKTFSIRALLLSAVLLCSIASAAPVWAQGSPLNLLGFGRPLEAWNARIDALSGAGTALTDPRIVNGPNPASWSWLSRARLESELHFDITQSTQDNLPTARNQDLHLGGFIFGSPMWERYHMSIALGFRPLTDAGASLTSGDSLQKYNYKSSGGASEAFLGLAGQVQPGVAVGAEFDVLFGNVRHLGQDQFADPAVANGNFERDYSLTGLRTTLGLLLAGDSLSEILHGLSLGVTVTTPSSLTMNSRTVITPVTSQLDTELETTGKGYYPASFTVGLGVRLSPRSQLIADFASQDFSKAYLFTQTTSTGDPTLGASTRYSVGIDRAPIMGIESANTGYWERVGLRVGASYYQLPFRPANSGGYNAIAGSLGIGLPLGLESLLDLSFTGGQRSPVNLGSAPKDLFFRLGATISLSERWFVPSRTDD